MQWIATIFLTLSFAHAVAQSEPTPASHTEVYVPPRIDPARKQPNLNDLYPRYNREALVFVRFTVDASGNVRDTEVLDRGFSERKFAEVSVQMVKGLKFLPATLDGQPVESIGQVIPIRFSMMDRGKGVTEEFQRELKQVRTLAEQKDLEGAYNHTQLMLAGIVRWNYEYAMLNLTLGQTLTDIGEIPQALEAFREATTRITSRFSSYQPGDPIPVVTEESFFLNKAMLKPALVMRAKLAASQGFYLDAVRALADLQGLEPIPADDPAVRLFNALTGMLTGGSPLVGKAIIGQSGNWDHELAYRNFSLETPENTDSIAMTLSCRGMRVELKYQRGTEWNNPSDWGTCGLRLKATPGTAFTIHEHSGKPATNASPPG